MGPSSGDDQREVVAFSISCDRADRSIVHMPAPRAAVRHAIPLVLEGLVAACEL